MAYPRVKISSPQTANVPTNTASTAFTIDLVVNDTFTSLPANYDGLKAWFTLGSSLSNHLTNITASSDGEKMTFTFSFSALGAEDLSSNNTIAFTGSQLTSTYQDVGTKGLTIASSGADGTVISVTATP